MWDNFNKIECISKLSEAGSLLDRCEIYCDDKHICKLINTEIYVIMGIIMEVIKSKGDENEE